MSYVLHRFTYAAAVVHKVCNSNSHLPDRNVTPSVVRAVYCYNRNGILLHIIQNRCTCTYFSSIITMCFLSCSLSDNKHMYVAWDRYRPTGPVATITGYRTSQLLLRLLLFAFFIHVRLHRRGHLPSEQVIAWLRRRRTM